MSLARPAVPLKTWVHLLHYSGFSRARSPLTRRYLRTPQFRIAPNHPIRSRVTRQRLDRSLCRGLLTRYNWTPQRLLTFYVPTSAFPPEIGLIGTHLHNISTRCM